MSHIEPRTATVFDLSMTCEGDMPFRIELKRTEHVGGPQDGEVMYELRIADDLIDEFDDVCDHYATISAMKAILKMMLVTVDHTHRLSD